MDDDFVPRNYQEALLEISVEKNSIIYLPTGSGKTFIAILLLKRLSEALSKPYSQGGKISFFVVNSVALVDQHANCIEKRTTLNVGRYSGDLSLDFWPKSKWYEEFDKHNVFVMTVQILVNLTHQHFIDLNKVNLIVFDECHRGVKDQAMRQLCMSFKGLEYPPRILGLTATLLNGNCSPNEVVKEVQELEVTYHGKVATVDGLSIVSGYSTNPMEKIKIFKDHISSSYENDAIIELNKIQEILKLVNTPDAKIQIPDPKLKPLNKEDTYKKLRNLINDVILHIQQLGLFGGSLTVLAHMIQMERLKKHCADANALIIFSYVQTCFTYIKKKCDLHMKSYSDLDKFRHFSSNKVLELVNVFDDYNKLSQEKLCALVFTTRRFTAKVLFYIFDFLSKNCSEYSHLKSDFMVGYNNNPYNNTREVLYTTKKNKEVLRSFDNKEINVLFSSNVLEEGVDITTCSLVIKFDYPLDYRAYIQSKGRARNPSSLYYMFVENSNYAKYMKRYQGYQKIENILQMLLIGQNDERDGASSEAIDNMYNKEQLPPYYVAGPNSAKVDMVSAISVVSAYCQLLGTDGYTTGAPEWFKEEIVLHDGKKMYSVSIILPKGCPINEIIKGPFMLTLKTAKRAAALKTCEMLHKCGELDDHLLPIKEIINEEEVGYLFEHYPPEKESLAGTNKNKRLHEKEIPDFIRGTITPGQPVFLHLIQLQPMFNRREEICQSTVYDMYSSNLSYGLLTPKPVPKVCDFPIYTSSGTLNVSLDVNVTQVVLTETDLKDIRHFYFTILRDLLDGVREFFIFDNGENAESLIAVPVDKETGQIDFDILRQRPEVKPAWVPLEENEKLSLEVTQETYLKKVVSPWYKSTGDYLVVEVSLNKSAKTNFPNESFASYEHYFEAKHNLKLVNPDLPLLYVKSISKKKNFTKPAGAMAKRKRDQDFENLEIHLIPELVVKQDIPGERWIQAHLLPTIVCRVLYLFRLEVFRIKIASEAKLGQEVVPDHPPLKLDEHLLNYNPLLEEPQVDTRVISRVQDGMVVPPPTTINVNKEYAKKMLEYDFPWNDSEEPIDIDRHLDVTIVDIDYYVKFISKSINEQDVMMKTVSSKRRTNHLALTYMKDYIEKPIKLLDVKSLPDGPTLAMMYQAMTTKKANDIVNMERLETLGDSFLKIMSSIYIYFKFPKYKEGRATQLKGRLVSNKNLYYLGKAKNIGGIMKTKDLEMADWLPPGFKLPDLAVEKINSKQMSLASLYNFTFTVDEQISGVLSENNVQAITNEQSEEDSSEEGLINDVAPFFKSNSVGDKNVADCVEALIGAYLQCTGIPGGIKFLEWMNIIPASEQLPVLLQQPVASPKLNDRATLSDINRHIPMWSDIETILGYHFNDRAYLLQAFTHASYTANRITNSYERLEFIGDAILDFLITCHIYEQSDKLDPGELTDLRSALVNNNTFASLVVRCNFHKHFLAINNKLQNIIDQFADYCEAKNFEIDDEVLILLEEHEAGLNLAEFVDVPKALGDLFEAIAGAIFLDSNKNLEIVWKVFHRIMWKEIETFSNNVPKNLVRRLYEWTPNPHPVFGHSVGVANNKVMVPLRFMLNGREQNVYGFGNNKNLAKKAAAKLALRQLKQ